MNWRERQKLKARPVLLASSQELRAYQAQHGISALRMAKMVKAKLEGQTS